MQGLLEWAECAPEYDEDGVLLWLGPRVKVGMAVGHDAAKRPLNTGADQGLGPKSKPLAAYAAGFANISDVKWLMIRHGTLADIVTCSRCIGTLRIAVCIINERQYHVWRPLMVDVHLYIGRADYFGEMPNLAARVAGLAHAGQILVEGTSGFTTRAGSGGAEKGSGGGGGSCVGAALSGLADRSYKRDDMVTRRALLPPDTSAQCQRGSTL